MRLLVVATLVLLTPLALAGSTVHDVRILGGGSAAVFTPIVLVIQSGESVRWTNEDLAGDRHVAVGSGFDTGILQPGETSASFVFDAPGTYFYNCPLHGTMRSAQVWVV